PPAHRPQAVGREPQPLRADRFGDRAAPPRAVRRQWLPRRVAWRGHPDRGAYRCSRGRARRAHLSATVQAGLEPGGRAGVPAGAVRAPVRPGVRVRPGPVARAAGGDLQAVSRDNPPHRHGVADMKHPVSRPLPRLLARLMARFSQRPDSEHGQATVRILVLTVVLVYLLLRGAGGSLDPSAYTAVLT